MYFLDLLGTLAFAITGAFRAKEAKITFFGVIFLGVITALGGGTLRDLIIGKVVLFYIKDLNYLFMAILGSCAAFFAPNFFKKRFSFFRFIDSVGLAAFTIIGVSATFNYLFADTAPGLTSFFPSVLMGMTTAFAGGVIRDALMGEISMAFRPGSNYALSAFLGSASFYALMFYNVAIGMIFSVALTLFMREIISKYGIYKRYFKR